MHGGLAPLASLPVGRPGLVGASRCWGPLRSAKFLLLGAGGAGATPQSHSPPPQPSSPEKLVQLFFSAAIFLWGCSLGLEALGRPTTSRRGRAGVAPGVGDHPLPAAPTPPGRARAARRQAESGSAAGCPTTAKFWDPSQ